MGWCVVRLPMKYKLVVDMKTSKGIVMSIRWIAPLLVLIFTASGIYVQGRMLPTDLCVDGTITPSESSILSDMQFTHQENPYILMNLSPECRYVIAVFKVSTAPEDERLFVGWDITVGNKMFEYIRPRITNNQIPVFHWNSDESEVLVGASHVTYKGDSFPIATYPFHLWKLNTGESYVLRCDGDYCLDPFFRHAIWDDHHNWVWSTGPTGAVAFDRNSGLVVDSYPNPPWDGGHYDFMYGHSIIFSDDMSHIIVYFDSNSAAGLTVWDINQHRAYPVYVANFLGGDIALSPNNRYLAVGYLAIRVWDLHNLESAYEDRLPIYRHEGPLPNHYSYLGDINELRFINNSIIETRVLREIQLWDLHTGELIEPESE